MLLAWELGSGESSSPHLGFAPRVGEGGRNNSATVNDKLIHTVKLDIPSLHK